jgi:hypothetical protein
MAAGLSEREAGRHRSERDRLIRSLRADDPVKWTYPRLAELLGCSKELIAVMVRGG